MRNLSAYAAKRIRNNHRRRLAWRRFVQSMAMIVVFCTTYALILPAITMQASSVCGMESHIHSDGCYASKPVLTLVCSHSEQDAHSDSCWWETGETTRELICTLPEHTHSDSCYPVAPEETMGIEYHCGYAEHIHGETCIDGEGNLNCSITEHAHRAECAVEDLDLTADMEAAEHWESMAAELAMSGTWAQNLLTMAESQIGYSESQRNCMLTEGQRYGYSRYGDWYGNPYQEWNALFVAFCLHYAGVPDHVIPVESDTQQWFAALLEQEKLIYTVQEHLPMPGDVVFCQNDGGSLYAAVVQKATAENGNLDALEFRVIAGDSHNQVETKVVAMDRIAGVCAMDLVQNTHEQSLEVQTEELPEPTDLAAERTEPVTESEEPAMEPTESLTEPTEPATESTEPMTEPAEATESVAYTVYTADTENYMVTVSCTPDLVIPEGAQLRVMEYSKDSEIYQRRCEEAGYELEWLLNIGFFLGDEELTLNGSFDVVVTSKYGDSLGQDITHFADSGTQHINGQEDEASVSFTSDGFSDFGGGVAARSTVVAERYNFVTVNPAQLQEGVDYVIYCNYNNRVTFLTSNGHPSANGDLHNAQQVSNWGLNNMPYNHNRSWSLTSDQMGTTESDFFTWQVVRRNGNTYLVNRHSHQELYIYNGWFHLVNAGSSESTPLSFTANGSGAYVRDSRNSKLGLRYDGTWRGIWTNDQGTYTNDPTTIYFASVNAQGRQFPHAVHTGDVEITRLRFYNLCENGSQGVAPLAGCTFEITGENGYTATVVSENKPEVQLPADIPDGTYTIKETSVPDGYVRDYRPARTFVVENGALVSDRTIGTFLNHDMEQLETGKTAEVESYVDRIYQIDMTAKSNMKHFQVEPLDLLFVVDQSNSMLFPAGLVDTGKTVTLRKNGENNVNNMNALNLDRSKVYYVIADPKGTSTVWAVWHDGSTWMTQDASYYAKAKHANEPGYQDDNETVIFPEDRSYSAQKEAEGTGIRSNGAGLGRDLTGSTLGTHLEKTGNIDTFTVYTATNEFNRLHYLEEALTNLIYQLADVNTENRVTLTRFTRVVNQDEDCFGPTELTPDNVELLAEEIRSIKTSGGTRQDIALQHASEQHLTKAGSHYQDSDHTYTLLITDGAPVFNKDTGPTSLGTADDRADTNSSTVYGRIKGWANEVKKNSTLLTVALGMEGVDAGKQVLEEIASGSNNYCAADDAAELMDFVQKLLFKSFRAGDPIDYYGDITDEISNSFYPIAWVSRGEGTAAGKRVLTSDSTRDWVLLEENDWITLDGRLTTAGASDARGQLLRESDGTFYVKWTNQYVSGSGWKGTFYVKAKEDFIGGNAIDTNKEASVTVDGSTEYLETPTVNVRLLDMNELHSEVTVYLGDQVNGAEDAPLNSLKYFYENTKFTKLISDSGNILNQITVDSVKGLEAAEFYLRYAMGADLTDAQWTQLTNGDSVTVPYTYDDESSHGAVGYFTFRLEKTGLGSQFFQHEALNACQPGGDPLTGDCSSPAETYTLNVTYTAYRLNQNGRPSGNVHNGPAGPGREVGTGTTVENGLGTVAKKNVHRVHVISGKIEIIKKFAEGITDDQPRTFRFTLHPVDAGPDTSRDVTKTITIPAGASAGSASLIFDGLRRGSYTVTEAVDEDYVLKGITVLESTNSYTEPGIGGTDKTLLVTMGSNVANENVIGKADPSDRYTSYTDPVNGVYAAAEFTNGPIVYPAQISVEKLWHDGDIDHSGDFVYMVLYLEDAPVIDREGNAQLLRLDAASGWKGTFTVYLADESDSLDNYHYSIREVSQVKTDNVPGWHPAILENDGKTLLYYEEAVENGRLFAVNGKSYIVEYGVGEQGQLTATNYWGTVLPQTGGMGNHMYTFSGMLLILAAALIYGYSQRRNGRRGACR